MAAQNPGQTDTNPTTYSNLNRITAIETLLPHLATKADIANLRTDIESLRSEINTLRWLIVVAIAVTGIVVQLLNQGAA